MGLATYAQERKGCADVERIAKRIQDPCRRTDCLQRSSYPLWGADIPTLDRFGQSTEAINPASKFTEDVGGKTNMSSSVRHPAKYTDALLPIFASLIPPFTKGLDPFGGTGKIFRIEQFVEGVDIECVELEPEWAAYDSRITLGNALHLPFQPESFNWVCTSPTYGNRMADHHEARDCSRRNTYRHAIGRKLHPDNSGALQWGDGYRAFHLQAWSEVFRVLLPSGLFVLNVKDHIRSGHVIPVCEWHKTAVLSLGFHLQSEHKAQCPGNRQGKNGNVRIDYEMVYCFRKEGYENRT